MSSTNFANGVTLTDADWFNDLNRLHYVIFADASSIGSAHTAFFSVTVGAATVFASLNALAFSASAGSANSLSVGNLSVSAGTANALAIKDASISAVAGLAVATQAQMEAVSSTSTIVTPGRAHFHPGVAKVVCRFDGTATSVTAGQAYNVAAISDIGSGIYAVAFTTAFSANGAYAWAVDSTADHTRVRSVSAGSITVVCVDSVGAAVDAAAVSVIAFGDFA